MRNYILTRMLQGNLHGDDGVGGTLDIPCTAAAQTDEKLYDLYQAQAAFLEQGNDPTHIYTWTQEFPNPITSVYWQFDSTNVCIFANYFADLFYLIAVTLGNIPQCGIMKAKLGTDYSPRKGWTDDAGVKRKPTPSDQHGKAIISIDIITFLAFIINNYVAAGDLPRANAVRQLVLDLNSKTITATEALEKLALIQGPQAAIVKF